MNEFFSNFRTLLFVYIISQWGLAKAAPPTNDNCANAVSINVSASGFGLGTFASANYDLTSATVETGENFYSTILSAGQNKKSVWFKFSLPTARKCTLFVKQPTPLISGSDVGFTIYKANGCFPTSAQADSALLASQTVFGYSTNPCLKSGDYYVQVSSKLSANGPIFIELVLDTPNPAPYDFGFQAYDFGVLNSCQNDVNHQVGCQTINGTTEMCSGLGADWSQSTWYTFTTPAYHDFISVLVTPPNGYNFPTGALPTIGYNLYQGDAKTIPIGSLSLIDGCVRDTINGYYDNFQRNYSCSLLPNTTYSVQLFFPAAFEDMVRVGVNCIGTQAGLGPRPTLVGITSTNKMGLLPGGNTTVYDYMGCNTRMSGNACGTENPTTGVLHNSIQYELADWFTFELSQPANVNFNISNNGGTLHCRLYNKDVTANCTNITAGDKINEWDNYIALTCLPAGKYSLQTLGNDDALNYWNSGCYNFASNLGQQTTVQLDITYTNSNNKYSLNVSSAFDTVNRLVGVMSSLKQDTVYTTRLDTFGCNNTVLPVDSDKCNGSGFQYPATNTKAIYREFTIGDANGDGSLDSGVVFMQFNNNRNYWYNEHKLYRGNASTLTQLQNKHFYPDTFTGLTPASTCIGNQYCIEPHACVYPGTYTLVTYGDSTDVGYFENNTIQLQLQKRKHYSPATAQNMGNILDTIGSNNGSVNSDITYFTCYDNPATIAGQVPCGGYNGQLKNKLIYRQFYLSQISNASLVTNGICNTGIFTLFKGQVSAGVGGLSVYSPAATCVSSYATPACEPLPAGWYTIVSYADGPTYANPTSQYYGDYGGWGGSAGLPNQITISITPAPPGPQFNRPRKASIDTATNLPYYLKFGNRGTAAFPVTDSTYTLQTEYYNCATDTPFSTHPISNCEAAYPDNYTRVTYWVFKITQESYVRFSDLGSSNNRAKVYAFDVRTDSARMMIDNPIQPCINNPDYIALCRLQPGTYTLVLFPNIIYQGASITPSVYIDNVGYSRFDHANGAYDFATVPNDSIWRSGKVGDVNPLNASRAASNDFFYCTTGARTSDPSPNPIGCYLYYDSFIYNTPPTNVPQYNNNSNFSTSAIRNLWYTFVLNYGGTCRVRVNNKTPNKTSQYPFAIYSSDVNGTLPFATVKSTGQVDSTDAQGLEKIKDNSSGYWCYYYNDISFFKNPCIGTQTRYYIKVENTYDLEPNSQCEVEILYDTIITPPVKFDHYSKANTINVTGAGTFCGQTDNFTCASKDTLDPSPTGCNPRNLWYKVVITSSGYLSLNYNINNSLHGYDNELTLFRQTIPGDSTARGLQHLALQSVYDYSENSYWGQVCVSPGTYYIIMTGCNNLNENVFPCVKFSEQTGDYCSNATSAIISSPSVVNLNTIIDCHTIGNDFGEDGSNMGCLIPNGNPIDQYKSTWYKIIITGNDTFDITPAITENTNVNANLIRYRLMIGDCNAMNTGSCFVSSLTVNTFNCLVKGTYFIQVVSPIYSDIYNTPTTGDISVQFTAVKSPPGCNPVQTCFVVAGFTTTSPCNTDSTIFVNTSTAGDSIQYHWELGYNNDTSNLRNPHYFYPAPLDSQTYSVLLIVTNTSCNQIDSVRQIINVKKKPHISLRNDTNLCFDKYTYYYDTIKANGWPAGTTYLWDNNTTDSVYYLQDYNYYFSQNFVHWVRASYNECDVTDTFTLVLKPKPVVDLGSDVILCNGQDFNGSIYNGINLESYLWSTGSNADNITTNTSGLLWGQVSADGCVARDTILLTNATTSQPLGNDTFICAGSSLELDATIANATDYLWEDGSVNPLRTVVDSGLYWVDITIGSCSIRDSIKITRANATKPFITGDSILCPVGDSAIIFVNGTFSSYSWNNASTNDSLQVYTAGSYRVTVTNIQGCASADTILVVASPTMTLTSIDTMVQCYGHANGKIKLTVTGGTPSYTFVWENASIAQNRSNLAPGNYSVTVTDGAGCKSSKSDTITQPTLLSATALAQDDSCYLANKGKITATPAGGTAPYSYAWSGGGSGNTKINIGVGVYTVTITDKNLCTITILDTVSQPAQLLLSKIDSTIQCYGTATGKIDLSINGGTAGYTYIWSNSSITQDIQNIAAGIYSVTVRDANLCSAVLRDTLYNPDSLLLNFNVVNISCGGGNNGAINLTASGGTPSYTFVWENAATTEDRAGLAAGNYTVTVTDNNSCTATKSATILAAGSPILQSADTAVRCFGAMSGRSTLITVGGSAPFSYLWSDGDTNKVRQNLGAGIYTATVSDGAGCNATDSIFITQPTALNATHLDTNVSCYGGNNGRIRLLPTGGTGAYSFNWGGGVSTQNRTALVAGTYCVTITDAQNCTYSTCANLSEPPLLSVAKTDSAIRCFGGSDGKIFLTASGGNPGYNYIWGNATTSSSLQNLSAGIYAATVSDANNCSVLVRDTILQPLPLTLLLIPTSVGCSNPNSGRVDLTASGGNALYSYIWSNGALTEDIGSLSVGLYTVTVSDAKNCTQIDSAFVTNTVPFVVNSIDSNVRCAGDSTGKIRLFAIGGAPPYTYLWENGSTDSIRQNLAGGTYTVTVTDMVGCKAEDTIIITEPVALNLQQIDTNVSCFNGSDGSINISIFGGVLPYAFSWNNGQTTKDITNLLAGTYCLTLTDANNCSISVCENISQPQQISITDTLLNVRCAGGNDGSIQLGIVGGSGNSQLIWSTNQTTAAIANLSAGIYRVSITDQNMCTKIDSFRIIEPLPIAITHEDSTIRCFGDSNGSIRIHASGGNGGYSYIWSNGISDSVNLNLSANTYQLTIYDARQCSFTDSIILAEPSLITSQIVTTNSTCFGANNASLDLSVNNGSAPYTFLWNTTATTEDITSVSDGIQSVRVTDMNGCIHLDSALVSSPSQLVINISDTDATCYGLANGHADIMVSGGISPYTYTWSSIGSGAAFTTLPSGNYSITVRDINLCSAYDSFNIAQPDSFTITALLDSVSCFGMADGAIDLSVTGQNGGYAYAWSNTQTSEDLTSLTATTYSVTISDTKNCSIIKSFGLPQPAVLTVNLIADSVKCFGLSNGNITSSVTGGNSSYSYSWNTTATTASLINIPIGNYSLTVTDVKNCTASAQASISQPDSLIINSIATFPLCYGAATGKIDLQINGGSPTYSYLWSNSATSEDIINLVANTYSVTVRDTKNCSKSISLILSQPPALSLNLMADSASCSYLQNGRIQSSVSGGVIPYSYIWSNSATTKDIDSLAASIYSLNVIDSNGCNMSKSIAVYSPATLQLSSVIQPVKCYGIADGQIDLTTTGGTKNYSYQWSNGSTNTINTGLISNTYKVTITDAQQCTATDDFYVSQPDSLSSIVTIINETCLNARNGIIDVAASGGTPAYNYKWSNGATTSNLTNIPNGSFSLTITDANQCSSTVTAVVAREQNMQLQAFVTNPSCPQVNNGAVFISINGGSGPFQFLWNDGNKIANRTGLSDGNFEVIVSDKFGCMVDTTLLLTYEYELDVEASPDEITIDLGESIAITTSSNTANTVNYNWTPTFFISCSDCPDPIASPIGNAIYVVQIRDSIGCYADDSVRISVRSNHNLYVPNAFTPNGDGTNDFFEFFGNKKAIRYVGISIFNRWGEKVFESNDLNFKWDGTYRGELLGPGIFVYSLVVSFVDGYRLENQKGSLSLIR